MYVCAVLKEYYRVLERKHALIQKYEQEEKWKEYTIEVHTLKSSSRQIGAHELASIAEHMEAAGNAQDAKLIHETTPEMLKKYMEYKDILKPYFTKEEVEKTGGQINAKELKEFFVRLREAMDNLDMDAMEDAVKDMDIYSYSGEHKEFYEDIKNAVEDIDIEQCEEIIGKWEESLQ